MQLIGVISTLAGIYTATYQPKIVQFRVEQNREAIKSLYLKGTLVLFLTFVVGGAGLLFVGPWGLNIIGSKTQLMPFSIMTLAIAVALEESNLSMAGSILLTKNVVPFFKASLISGGIIIIGLVFGFKFMHLGLVGMVLIPLIVDAAYQAWKWPFEVVKDLRLSIRDILQLLHNISK